MQLDYHAMLALSADVHPMVVSEPLGQPAIIACTRVARVHASVPLASFTLAVAFPIAGAM